MFWNNGLIAEILEENGEGRVLVVDGGGAVRRALIDAELAQLAADNDWAGIIVYGAVRQIQQLENIDIGIHALAPIPVGADENIMVKVIFQWILVAWRSSLKITFMPI